MPAAQVIDLSPIPNRSGAMFGEGFADRYIEKDRQQQNNKWFEDAIGDEQDPLQQAAKLGMSKHPLDPEYVKEKRKQLFENAEMMQAQDKITRDKKKESDAAEKEAKTLAFYEDQMGLQPGTLSGGSAAAVAPFAAEHVKNKTKKKEMDDRKQALMDAYPEIVSKIPKPALQNMDDKQLGDYVKNELKPKKAETTGLKGSDPAVKLAYKQYEEIGKMGKAADDTLKTVKDARKAVEEGGGDASVKNAIGQVIPWFKSGSTATLENASTELFKHFKTIFPKMTNVDVHLIEDVLPAVYNSREANNAILDIYESAGNYAKEKERISDELIEEMNKGEIQPYEFQRLLKERTEGIEKEVLDTIRETATAVRDRITERVEEGYTAMISTSGGVAQIPNDRVEEALNSKQWKLYGR